MDGDGSGDFNAHTNANDFLMVMVHYSWITVLIVTLLGIFSYMSHRRKQKGHVPLGLCFRARKRRLLIVDRLFFSSWT